MYSNSQPEQFYSSAPSDSVDLIDLWRILSKYKQFIIIFTISTTLISAYYVFSLPVVYKTQVAMLSKDNGNGSISGNLGKLGNIAGLSLGGGGSSESEKAIARLETRNFLSRYIKEKNLKPILFSNQWDEEKEKWLDVEPSDIEASELLLDMMTVSRDGNSKSGLIYLILEWKNLSDNNINKIARITNELINSVNLHEKNIAIVDAKNSIEFLEKEIDHTDVLRSKAILYKLIEQQMSKIMLANIKQEFIFNIIDPAIKPSKPESNNAIVIAFAGFFLGIIFGSFFAVFVDKTKDDKNL